MIEGKCYETNLTCLDSEYAKKELVNGKLTKYC